MSFDKQGLIALFQPKVRAVEIEAEGVKAVVYVKELSTAKVFDLQQKRESMKNKNLDFSLLVLQETLVDENGAPAFTAEEIKLIASTKISFFKKLNEVAAKASGLQPDEEKKGNE